MLLPVGNSDRSDPNRLFVPCRRQIRPRWDRDCRQAPVVTDLGKRAQADTCHRYGGLLGVQCPGQGGASWPAGDVHVGTAQAVLHAPVNLKAAHRGTGRPRRRVRDGFNCRHGRSWSAAAGARVLWVWWLPRFRRARVRQGRSRGTVAGRGSYGRCAWRWPHDAHAADLCRDHTQRRCRPPFRGTAPAPARSDRNPLHSNASPRGERCVGSRAWARSSTDAGVNGDAADEPAVKRSELHLL